MDKYCDLVLWIWSICGSLRSLVVGSGVIAVQFPLPGGHRRLSGQDKDCAVFQGENNRTGHPTSGNHRERE